eukprot:scaffold105741_cov47-Prasinocladus_malaysianus.AAC.1
MSFLLVVELLCGVRGVSFVLLSSTSWQGMDFSYGQKGRTTDFVTPRCYYATSRPGIKRPGRTLPCSF